MATYVISPSPYQTVLDTNGNPVVGALITTYLAGTSTPVATYTDVTGVTPNTQPIVADSAGRWSAWLDVTLSYKFAITDSLGVPIRTVDNIMGGVSPSAASIDVLGTAGETLAAGKAVYLSDGSGSKTAGRWYLADSANPYSSSNAVLVGMTQAAIATGSPGLIRTSGIVTGLTGLTIGLTYYVGSGGVLTATAPANPRVVGLANTATSLMLASIPPVALARNGINDFRLTLETGVPVSFSDQLAKTTIYCTPYTGTRLALFDSAGVATIYSSVEFSLAIPGGTLGIFDIFCYANAGVPTLEFLAWTNDTTRATAIVRTTTGVLTKSGDLTRRYLGTYRTTTAAGQTEDSTAKRLLYNYENRALRDLYKTDATASWSYATATIRQVRATATNQVEAVLGVGDALIVAQYGVAAGNDQASLQPHLYGVGLDSTTAFAAQMVGGISITGPTANMQLAGVASVNLKPAAGYHTITMLEKGPGAGTTTWFGSATYATSAVLTGAIWN